MEMVQFRNYSFTYPGATGPTLKKINLSIEEGSIVGVVGPTGSGKSTLIKSLNGLVPKFTGGEQEGEVIVDGLNVREHEIPTMARHVGVVLDDPETQLFSLTVEDDVAFGPSNLGLPVDEIKKRSAEALKDTELELLRYRIPSELSGGEKQSLAIAGILAMRPKVMVFDEPLAMLDPIGKHKVTSVIERIVKKGKSTVILTEAGADIETMAGILDRMIVLYNGEILQDGNPRDILQGEVLPKIGVDRPQVTNFFMSIKKDMPDLPIPVTLEEAVKYFQEHLVTYTPQLKKEIFRRRKKRKTTREPVIKVRNLHHVYPPNIHALRGISLDVYPETIIGIIGQNGSGKTTLSVHLVGLLKPTNKDAEVLVDGLDVMRTPIEEIIKHINYVYQNPDSQLFCKSVIEEVSFGLKMLGLPDVKKRVNEALKFFELEDYRFDLPSRLPRHLKKRVAMCSIFAMNPKIVILDEPTSGLDTKEISKIMEKILKINRENRTTIIIISHDMKTIAAYCNYVIAMTMGKVLLSGTPREVFSKSEILEKDELAPPQITKFSQVTNLQKDILTVEEMKGFVSRWLGKEGN